MIYDKEYLATLKRSHPRSIVPYILAIHPVTYFGLWMLLGIVIGIFL